MNKIDSRIVNGVAAIVLVVILSLCFYMSTKIERKLAFIIDDIELANRDSVTIGENSDICFNKVPHDYLTIIRDGDHFTWKVNKEYHDSLQYVKINNTNPNLHAIKNDDSQRIILNLPTSSHDTIHETITGKELYEAWNSRFSEQQNVMVRHFAANNKLAQKNVTKSDSLKYLNQMQCHDVRSFFNKSGNEISIVILDNLTRVEGNDGTVTSFVDSGTTEPGEPIKVQFFSVGTHCYLDKSPDGGSFKIDGVNYVMKPSVKLTEWGAGHVMIKSVGENTWRLSFPKPITFVGTVDSLRQFSEQSSNMISLKQNNNSFPNKSDLYLPAFSGAINYDVCNLVFGGDGSVMIRGNNFDSTLVSNPHTGILPFSLIPAFKSINLCSGNDVIHARTGFIDQQFIFSYMWLPLLVALALMALIWLPVSPLRIPDKALNLVYNRSQIKNYRIYLSLLIMVCLAYCACKSLIAIKLSYTFPYFEKLTGITPVATGLMMLLFFSFAMLLNMPMLHLMDKQSNADFEFARQRKRQRNNKRKLWFLWIGCCLILLALAYAFFGLLDKQVNRGVIDSYFHSEIFAKNPFKWSDASSVGINDTHRSVVYTLLVIEVAVLIIWAVLNVCYAKAAGAFQKAANAWSNFIVTQKAAVRKQVSNFIKPVSESLNKNKLLKSVGKRWVVLILCLALLGLWQLIGCLIPQMSLPGIIVAIILALIVATAIFPEFYNTVISAVVGTFKVLFPTHFILLFILVGIGSVLGNFATAFITLGVIIGLSRALSVTSIEISDEHITRRRYSVLLQMFFISLVYTGFAMTGDHGYMTNSLGFIMFVFALFFMVKRPEGFLSPEAERERKKERKWVAIMTVSLAVVIWFLPTVCSMIFNPENVNYDRMPRRMMLYSNFDDLQKSGYRYSESDAEFMVIMSHYMQSDSLARHNHDPLSNDAHFMHPSVSSGQSPVALNDLSVPIAFFGSYGSFVTYVVYFALLALLLWIVMCHTLAYKDKYDARLTRSCQWRLLAMFMWVGTSLYIFFSYIDWLPFTGRLNPGFGVDSVGEALESAFLLAFMASVTGRRKSTMSN